VKLWQFDMDDRNQFRKNMADELANPVNGVATAELHRDDHETVTYNHIDAGTEFTNADAGGIEMFVLAGSISEGGETLVKGTWLRLPDGTSLSAVAGADGAKVWIKTGHLRYAKPPAV
jgi:hypothetical protein